MKLKHYIKTVSYMTYNLATKLRRQPKIWLDVGSHFGERTLVSARLDSSLLVYAFEPNINAFVRRLGLLRNFVVMPFAVSEVDGCATLHNFADTSGCTLLPFKGLYDTVVPTIRLDTFMNLAGIRKVDFLKVDTQGTDLCVVKSLGKRISVVRKITLEVPTAEVPFIAGGTTKTDAVAYLTEHRFRIEEVETQSHNQEENITFTNEAL